MADTYTNFTADIDKFLRKTKLAAETVISTIAEETVDALIFASPVDTGNFRSHWRASLNSIDPYWVPDGRIQLLARGIKGIPAVDAVASKVELKKYTLTDTIYITNNVVYGPREEGPTGRGLDGSGLGSEGLNDGSSPQAAAGWVEKALQDTFNKYT